MDVGPHRWLNVGCGYGCLLLFESAGVGVCCCLRVLVQLWALVAVERWWCRCGYLSPSEGGGTGMGPHCQLKVECGYGPSSPFESAGVGMGVHHYLRVLVQVWLSSRSYHCPPNSCRNPVE